MQNFKVKDLNLEEVNSSLLSLEDAANEANQTSVNTFLVLNSYLTVLERSLSTLQYQYARLVYYKTIFERVLEELNPHDDSSDDSSE